MSEESAEIRAYGGDGPYVFVSYAHADRDEMLRELRWLIDAGYNIWFDEGISPAHDWPEELAGAIESASLFLLFVTGRSVASDNCSRETTFAVSHGTPVLAIYLEPVSLPRGLELSIGNSQAIFKHETSANVYREKVLSALDGYLGKTHEPIESRNDASARLIPILAVAGVVLVSGILLWLAIPTLSDRTDEKLEALDAMVVQLERVIGSNEFNTLEPYLLAREIEHSVPAETWSKIAITGAALTDPPNAAISVRPLDATEQWFLIGRADGEPRHFPRGQYVYRLELPGYHARTFYGDALLLFTRTYRAPDDDLTLGLARADGPRLEHIPRSVTNPSGTNYVTDPFVTVPPFKVARFEVTNREYKAFVDAGGYEAEQFWTDLPPGMRFDEVASTFVDRTGRPGPSNWEVGTYPLDGADHPVGGVNWFEAMAYARFRGASLPTAYHWAQASFPYYASTLAPHSNMNAANSIAVDELNLPGPLGTQGTFGNVREWALNKWGERRWIMGGGWTDPEYLAALPFSLPPTDRTDLNGIRLYYFDEPYPEAFAAPRDASVLDYNDAQPVSDDAFEVIADQYVDTGDPVEAEVVSIVQNENWERETVRLTANLPGEFFDVHLFKPRGGKPPYQVVTYAPPISDFWSKGDSSQIDLTRRFLPLDLIPRSGRALVWPVYFGSFERYAGIFNVSPARRDQLQTELRVNWYADLKRTLDYLESREDLDADRLAWLGYSYGASHFLPLLALEKRYKVAVLIGGGLANIGIANMPQAANPLNFLPRITTPVLMINGKNDFVFPLETSQEPTYHLLGTPPEHKQHLVLDGDHYQIPSAAFTRDTTRWFDKYLGAP